MGRTYPRREIAARKEYFAKTDEVIGLFQQPAEQAQQGMKSLVLMERQVPNIVKLYDAETGAMTDAVKKKEAEEYPYLKAMAAGFLICMSIWLVAMYIAGVI